MASGMLDLLDIFSQIGSTSGPSRSPAPSHPQHHTKKSGQHSALNVKPAAVEGSTSHAHISPDTGIYGIALATSKIAKGGNRHRVQGELTVFRSRHKVDGLTLLFDEQPIVGTEPRSVLRIRSGIVRQSTQPDITPDGGQVSPCWMDSRENSLRKESAFSTEVAENILVRCRKPA